MTATGFIRWGEHDVAVAGFLGLLWPLLAPAYLMGVAGLRLMTVIGKAGKYLERKLL